MTKNTKIIGGIVIIIIVIVLVAVFYKPAPEGTIKIGVLTPLTGNVGEYGNNAKNGIDLAAEEINQKGGINGKQIQLFYEDSKCDAKEAVSVFNKLVEINNVSFILGTICSGETLAIIPLAKEKNVLILSTGASSPELSGKGIFRFYPSDSYDAEVAADLIFNRLNSRRVSVIYLNNDYGTALKTAFHKKFSSFSSSEILNEESYLQTDKDFRSQLTKILDKNPEVIYLISYPSDAALLVKQIKEMGISAKLLGSSGLKAEDLISKGGEAVEKFILTTPSEISSDARNKFLESFEKKFNQKAGFVSDMAYDSLYVLRQAAEDAKSINEIANNLSKIKNYNGASGEITLNENGDRVGVKYDILMIKNGQFVPYEN